VKRSVLAAALIVLFLLPIGAFWQGWIQFYRMADLQVMAPTVKPGDGLLVETWSDEPDRDDLIVFTSHNIPGLISEPSHPAETVYLQRLVALPGDELVLREGHLFVNGSQWEPGHWMGELGAGDFFSEGENKIVPDGKWFVLADNYPEARDSRHWGYVPSENYVGRVLRVFSRE